MLTPKQKQIYEFIKKFSKKEEYSPSLLEIKKRFKLKAISTVHQHIKAIEAKGYLATQWNQKRSIKIPKKEKMVSIPLLGTIAAGEPIHVFEEEKESIAISKSKIPSSSEVYALRVTGDSMIDENIHDGDTILIKKQSVAENGNKVVALLNRNEATLKTFYKERGQIRLQPANKSYQPILVKKVGAVKIRGIVLDIIGYQ